MMVGYKREELRTNGKEEAADYLFPFYLLDKTAKICIGDIIYITLTQQRVYGHHDVPYLNEAHQRLLSDFL